MVEKFRLDNYRLHHLNYAIHPLGPPSGTLRRCRKSRDFSRPDPPQLFFTCHCFLCLTQTCFLNRSTQYHPSKPSLPDSPLSSTSQLNCPPPRQIIHHINLTPIVEPVNLFPKVQNRETSGEAPSFKHDLYQLQSLILVGSPG